MGNKRKVYFQAGEKAYVVGYKLLRGLNAFFCGWHLKISTLHPTSRRRP